MRFYLNIQCEYRFESWLSLWSGFPQLVGQNRREINIGIHFQISQLYDCRFSKNQVLLKNSIVSARKLTSLMFSILCFYQKDFSMFEDCFQSVYVCVYNVRPQEIFMTLYSLLVN